VSQPYEKLNKEEALRSIELNHLSASFSGVDVSLPHYYTINNIYIA